MKINPRFIRDAKKAPLSAQVFQLIGVCQFIAAAFFPMVISSLLGFGLGTIGVIIALIIGATASAASFGIARIIIDLHTLSVNSEGYVLDEEEEGSIEAIEESIENMSADIEEMLEIMRSKRRNPKAKPVVLQEQKNQQPDSFIQEEGQPKQDNDPFDDFDWEGQES